MDLLGLIVIKLFGGQKLIKFWHRNYTVETAYLP